MTEDVERRRTALMYAAYRGHHELIPIFLELDLRKVNNNKYTALIYAVLTNKVECVKLLLTEVGIVSDFGTALMIAMRNRNVECVRVLIDFPEERRDMTKLMIGAMCGAIDIVL